MRRSAISPGWLAIGLVAMLCAASSAPAQVPYRNSFEGPEASWREIRGDTHYQLEIRRVEGQPHSGDWSERVRLRAANGSFVYIGQDVGPASLIEELRPSLWLRADRAGLQLLARVVFPRCLDPKTGAPAFLLIRGSQYSKVGQWEQLSIDDALRQTSRQVPILQAQLGPQTQVDTRGAYVDQVLLNVYGGEGNTEASIDDLELPGFVGRTDIRAAGPSKADAGLASEPAESPLIPRGKRPRVSLSGAVLSVDGRPFFTRAITYQGEPLSLLKQIGFDAVLIDEPPSAALLKEAAAADLWCICPPPRGVNSAGTPAESGQASPHNITPVISGLYDRVLLWNLGQGLRARDLVAVERRAEQIRLADRQVARPLFCQPGDELREYSRHCDLLASRLLPLSTSIEMKDYSNWLRQRPRLSRPGAPWWTVIQTQLPTELSWFVRPAGRAGEGQDSPPQASATPGQIRLLAFTAVAAGARGLVFDSQSRLDATDPATQTRARTLELLNLEMELLAPFAAGGEYVTTVSGNDPQVSAALLATSRARLLVPIWSGPGGQYVPGQTAYEELAFVVPGVPEANDVYELTPAGMRPLKHRRVAGGVRISIREFGLTSLVLLTKDPAVTSSLRRRLAQVQQRAAALSRDLARQELASVESVARAISASQPAPPQLLARLSASRANLEACDRATSGGDWQAAYLESQRALRPLRTLERVLWEDAIRGSGTPLTSPYCAAFSSLPDHWALMTDVNYARPSPNQMPAGDFENFEQLLAAGWQNLQYPLAGIKQKAELSDENPHGGRYCLRLRARAVDPATSPELIETPPLWIVSAGVPMEANRWVRIRGWVRIAAPITGSIDGLTISDSLSGLPLALRFGRTDGWKEFTMYRFVPRSGDLSLTFSLTGIGEAFIDDVSVESLEAPRPSSGQAQASN